MNNLMYLAPIFAVILSNVCYHMISKTVSGSVNQFLALTCTYGVSFLACGLMYLFTKKQSLVQDAGDLRWSNFILGIIIIGIEGGYMLMYRSGWEVSKGSLIANLSVACILLVIGF